MLSQAKNKYPWFFSLVGLAYFHEQEFAGWHRCLCRGTETCMNQSRGWGGQSQGMRVVGRSPENSYSADSTQCKRPPLPTQIRNTPGVCRAQAGLLGAHSPGRPRGSFPPQGGRMTVGSPVGQAGSRGPECSLLPPGPAPPPSASLPHHVSVTSSLRSLPFVAVLTGTGWQSALI